MMLEEIGVLVVATVGKMPDAAFVRVKCNEDQMAAGEHYQAAQRWATHKWRPASVDDVICIDELDPGRWLMKAIAHWDLATVINVWEWRDYVP